MGEPEAEGDEPQAEERECGDALVEKTPAGAPPRFVKMFEVEEDYVGRDLTEPLRRAARQRILGIIQDYRAH